MNEYNLRELGWKPFFDRQVTLEQSALLPARVAAHFGSQIVIQLQTGEAAVPTKLTQGQKVRQDDQDSSGEQAQVA